LATSSEQNIKPKLSRNLSSMIHSIYVLSIILHVYSYTVLDIALWQRRLYNSLLLGLSGLKLPFVGLWLNVWHQKRIAIRSKGTASGPSDRGAFHQRS
jgi:hypothetical protein